MYITYKDAKRFKSYTNSVNERIDMMFNGIDITSMEPVETHFEQEKLVRTITTTIEETNLNTVETTKITRQLSYLFLLLTDTLVQIPNPSEEYESFKIPKKTKGFRQIDAPKTELKQKQKEIANILTNQLKILPHDSAWAYTTGRDVVGAMKEHVNNKSRWYLKLDLKNFFGSCSPEFIIQQLSNLYPFAIIKQPDREILLTNLVTIACKDGGLPQGTPLSPVITNLIMVEYDYRINKMLYALTQKNKLLKQKYIYTRYADDIIISAKNKFDYKEIIKGIKKIFERTPLFINEDKTRFGSSAGRNWNLGVMCNKDNKITVGYRRKRDLKVTLHHYLTNEGTWDLDSLQWLMGQLSWLRNVEPDYFEGLMQYYYNKTNINAWNKIIQDIKNI